MRYVTVLPICFCAAIITKKITTKIRNVISLTKKKLVKELAK